MRWLALSLLAGCAARSPVQPAAPHHHAEGHHEAGHHGGPGHFTDPARYVASWNDPARDAWQKPDEIVAALRLAPGATVVDLGAGTGYLLPALSAAVGPEGAVTALDVEPPMIAFLADAIAREGWANVRTHLASAGDPGLPSAGADAVVTLNVWHHIDDRGAYAARVLDALTPGGAFVVVDFLKEATDGFGPPLAMRLSAEEVASDLRAGGFEVEILSETMPRHHVVRGVRPAAD